MDTMANTTMGARRRRYSPQLKLQVLAECEAPGALVAKVAMAHGINANVVHSWRKRSIPGAVTSARQAFLPVMLPPLANASAATDIQVQIKRGATTIDVTWPLSAAVQFGVWLREVLR